MKKAVVLFFTLIFLFVFGSCSLNLQKGENTVSYTHLDVYKRQV